jgi:hypothetical protein
MRVSGLLFRTSIYIAIAIGLSCLAVSIKMVSNAIAQDFFYKIIIIGDVFETLELVEFVNILVFAILGMGFGLATVLLPQNVRLQTSAVLLTILLPLVFSTNAIIQYNSWIEDVAVQEKISYDQAEQLTNSFLGDRVELNGFLGFYLYTAQVPILPLNQAEMKGAIELEKKVKSTFLSFNRIVKIKPEIVTGFLASSRWMIRFFYFSLAIATTVNHFQAGCQELVKRSKPKKTPVPYFPPVPPRFQTYPNPPNDPMSPAGLPKLPSQR